MRLSTLTILLNGAGVNVVGLGYVEEMPLPVDAVLGTVVPPLCTLREVCPSAEC